jgi:hypothetical protein
VLLPLLCLGAVVTGCTGSGDRAAAGGSEVAPLVVDASPAGYRLSVDRSLSAEDFSSATSSDPRSLAHTLAQTGFRGGWSRIWTSGDAYLSVVAAETATPFGAKELGQFQSAQLGAGRGVMSYADQDVPGARAFDFFATTRAGGRQVFCQAVLFDVDAYVFMLNDCNSAPRSADRVLATARQQYQRASTRVGVPVVTPRPS